jgi:hypothetical protein
VEGSGAGIDGNRIFGFVQRGKRLFELPNAVTHRDPPAIDDGRQSVFLLGTQDRFCYQKHE